MEKYIDLHTHSTCSDGTLTPAEVVKLAKNKGLSAIALTDHDTIDGLKEAVEAGKKYGIEVITGIEFSVTGNAPMHMLGLNFSMDCPAITDTLDELVRNRETRNIQVTEKLRELGFDVSIEEMLEFSTSNVTGRSQIARVMMKKGYVSTVKEAFEKYLGFGKPAYIKRKSLTPEKAIEIIKKSGGKAILAHLNQIGKTDEELCVLLRHLKEFGLDGIEGYYTEYTDDMNERYRKMADDLGLLLSGGSDFHGANKDGYELGTGKENLKIPYEVLEKIKQ